MKTRLFQVDAFTDKLFSGNPAAVCPLDRWLSDYHMQNIAMENNLAETAFFVKEDSRYHIRWFTPTVEVDLCGHATLAAAYVLFNIDGFEGNEIRFYSERSGELRVLRNDGLLTLDFPADNINKIELKDELIDGFGQTPVEGYRGKTDYMFVFETEEQIMAMQPDFEKIAKLAARGVIVTAKAREVDFVSRFFAPQSGINEDPVTGSAHTTLTPFWSKRMNKVHLTAKQLSARGGWLGCTLKGERVLISGAARLYLSGEIELA